MTNLQKERIALLRSQGESYARIADAFGISINTVQSYCRRNKLGSVFVAEQIQATEDTCVNCGNPLTHTPGSKKKRFCCDKCRMTWWAAHPEAVERKAVYHFACPTCRIAFTAYGNAKRKYCSRTCASGARKACHE